MEIERKWLIKELPSEIYKHKYSSNIKQGYISVDPEVRIRSNINEISDGTVFDRYFLSIKSNGTLSRMEVEIEISKDNFDSLLKLVPYDLISKKYFTYEFAGYTIEMSEVDGQWYYAEVEFESEEDAKAFVFPFPDLVIKETTDDPNFKMKNYWTKTRMQAKKDETKYAADNKPTIDDGSKWIYENTKDNLKTEYAADNNLTIDDGPKWEYHKPKIEDMKCPYPNYLPD